MLDREYGGGPITVDEGTPVVAGIGVGVAVVLLVALIPAMIRRQVLARRRRAYSRVAGPGGAVEAGSGRWEPAMTAAWAELDDALCDYGMSRQPSESPRALAGRLTEQYGFDAETSASMSRIATAVERMLFARTPGEVGPLRDGRRNPVSARF